MKNIFKNKRIPWAAIIFIIVSVFNLGLFLDYTIFAILDDVAFETYGINNFLFNFTITINALFILYHVVMLFWKNRTKCMLYAFGSASFMVFFYIIRLCLVWY